MAFGDAFIEELKGRLRLVDVIGRRVKLQKRGREWVGLSPFNKEKTPSFYVNEDKGFYHCFSSGQHGDIIAFVMQIEGLSFPEAVERLAAEAGLEVPRERGDGAAEKRRASLHEVLETATEWFRSQLFAGHGREALAYLRRRGLDDAAIARFRLGYAPPHRSLLKEAMAARGVPEADLVEAGLLIVPDEGGASFDRFRDRAIFPIGDRRGRIVAFGGRALGEARPKYLNSPETPLFHKGATLYNWASARQAAHDSGRLVVAEGYMDVIALVRAGLAHAVAPLGTALTEEQLELLWRMAPEPVICLDGDAAGQRAALRAAERALPLLRPGQSLGFVELPEGADPDSLLQRDGAERLRALLEAPVPLAEVLWRALLEGRSLDTPERRAGLRRDALALVGRIADATVRGYYEAEFQARIAALFRPAGADRQPQGRRALHGTAGRGSGRPGGWAERRPAGRPAVVDRVPQRHAPPVVEDAAIRVCERHILGLVLNHPETLDDRLLEELMGLHFRAAELDSLRSAIIEHVASAGALDVPALRSNLNARPLLALIDDLTAEAAPRLEPFARPGAGAGDVRRGLAVTLQRYRLEHLHEELRGMQQVLAGEPTEAVWARMQALRNEIERLSEETGAALSVPRVGAA